MSRKIKLITAALCYVFFLGVFISDNPHLESLAKKIEDEMIRPYTQRLSSDENPLDQHDSQSSSHEVAQVNAPISDTTDPTSTPEVTIIYVTPTPLEVNISEKSLWEGLKVYRAAHGKPDVIQSESLCTYARSRAQELFDRLQSNPDDPLDAHAGFSRDADSGKVFETTGFNTVGENLAYTPGYTSATQIIEWGWDTSPNHRSLQLSDDITHGCISGIHPIYVGIYTY